MVQLHRIQLTSKTPNHVEMTKILSTNQRESRIIIIIIIIIIISIMNLFFVDVEIVTVPIN